jgi:hypothetical protein
MYGIYGSARVEAGLVRFAQHDAGNSYTLNLMTITRWTASGRLRPSLFAIVLTGVMFFVLVIRGGALAAMARLGGRPSVGNLVPSSRASRWAAVVATFGVAVDWRPDSCYCSRFVMASSVVMLLRGGSGPPATRHTRTHTARASSWRSRGPIAAPCLIAARV